MVHADHITLLIGGKLSQATNYLTERSTEILKIPLHCFDAVTQTHNSSAETHLGGGDTSGHHCSSTLFDVCCQYSYYEGPTKVLTAQP